MHYTTCNKINVWQVITPIQFKDLCSKKWSLAGLAGTAWSAECQNTERGERPDCQTSLGLGFRLRFIVSKG